MTAHRDRREDLCAWLRANGIDPDEVPLDADMTITTVDNDARWLRCEVFVTDANGRRMLNERRTDVARDTVTVPLRAEPPSWWQPHLRPSREQLLEAIAAVGKLHVRNPNTRTCEHCSERDYPDYAVPWPCPTMRALGETEPPAPCGLTVAGAGTTPLGPCIVTGPHETHESADGTKWRPNPDGVITIPEPMTAEQVEAFRAEWNKRHAQKPTRGTVSRDQYREELGLPPLRDPKGDDADA
jgi:hypothetical protein